jgi:hypothetical protein
LIRLPAELDRSATELPVELTALLTPPERRVLVPCAAPDSTSPRPVCSNGVRRLGVLELATS